jgi:hypothetical protein
MKDVLQLEALRDRGLGPFTLQVRCVPRRRVGHFDLDVFLKDKKGQVSCGPVVTGIYSKGNPGNKIFGWLDIHFLDLFAFDGGDAQFLSERQGLAEGLFKVLGGCIPPGGMIICSYVTDFALRIASPLHEQTRRCLQVHSLKIPPAATPLGRLLVAAGCLNIKTGAYDVQGSSRLAGEKALNKEYEKLFKQRLIRQLERYLGRDPNPEYDIEAICRTNAREVVDHIIIKTEKQGT